jgi:RND family efflux transporter MFP subunit
MNLALSMQNLSMRSLCIWLLIGLLAGCSHAATDDDAADAGAGDQGGQVAVTTAKPAQQTFYDTLEAWGTAVGDPHRTRAISFAHGGQITGVQVVAGQTVTRGQPLLTITPDPATRNAYQQAQSALTLARGELGRTEQLAAQRLATQSQLANARKALADAQTTLEAQRALGGDAAQETVSAAADGVITAISVGLGERVAANAPLLNFTPTHALIAQLGVQPEDAASLRPGMPVQLRGVYGSAAVLAGTLTMVGQSADAQTHLLPVQVELSADASTTLVAGAALKAHIRTAEFTAWAVPRAAVLHDEHGDYLFQVQSSHAKRVDVKLRSPDSDTVGVQGPLDASAGVIVLGAYELDDGQAVRESTR